MPGNFNEISLEAFSSWPPPNYVDPERRTWLPAYTITFLAVSTLLLAGRLWLRARGQAGPLGLDDLFIFLGWAGSVLFSACAVIAAEVHGLDRHTWDVPPTHFDDAAFYGWLAQIAFISSTTATKISVLLFYRRMVHVSSSSPSSSADRHDRSRCWRLAIRLAIAFLVLFAISILTTYACICTPLSAYWRSYNFSYDTPFTCIDGNIISPLVGAVSVFTDIYTVALPFLMLRHYRLNIPRRQAILLNILFAGGLVPAACGVPRTYYLYQLNHTNDTSWAGFDVFVWSLPECHLAIIFACLPALRALIRRYLGEASAMSARSASRRSAPPYSFSTPRPPHGPPPPVHTFGPDVEKHAHLDDRKLPEVSNCPSSPASLSPSSLSSSSPSRSSSPSLQPGFNFDFVTALPRPR